MACLGSGSGKPGDQMYDMMKHVGRLLAGKYITATGGYGGSGMEAPIHGAYEAGGDVVGYGLGVPGLEPNQFLLKDGSSFENMADLRLFHVSAPDDYLMPHSEKQFGLRLGSLLEADGFIIDASGQIGTVVEVASIINFNMKLWPKTIGHTKPVAILHPPSILLGVGNSMFDVLAAFGVCPAREKMPFLAVFPSPEEAFNWVDTRIQ